MTTNFILLVATLFATSCSVGYLDKRADSPKAPQVIELTQKTQNLHRYDCDGRKVSESTEVTENQILTLNLEPETRKDMYDSRFYNMSTNSRAKCVIEDSTFRIGLRKEKCVMQVKQGINEISYAYIYCDEYQKDEDGNDTLACAKIPEVLETGTIFVQVNLINDFEGGYEIVEPSREECQARKQPLNQREKRLVERELQKNPLSLSYPLGNPASRW